MPIKSESGLEAKLLTPYVPVVYDDCFMVNLKGVTVGVQGRRVAELLKQGFKFAGETPKPIDPDLANRVKNLPSTPHSSAPEAEAEAEAEKTPEPSAKPRRR